MMSQGLKRRVYQVLEVAHPDDRLSRNIDRALIALIVTNVLAVVVETVEPIHARYEAEFWAFEVASVLLLRLLPRAVSTMGGFQKTKSFPP